MNHVSLALKLLLVSSVVSYSNMYEISVVTINGKHYVNGKYEVETDNGNINIVNGEIEGIKSKRLLSKEERIQLDNYIKTQEQMYKENAYKIKTAWEEQWNNQKRFNKDIENNIKYWSNNMFSNNNKNDMSFNNNNNNNNWSPNYDYYEYDD